jgi:hypothetical protein
VTHPYQQCSDGQLADCLDRLASETADADDRQLLAEAAWRLRHPAGGAVVTDCVSGGDIVVTAHGRRR